MRQQPTVVVVVVVVLLFFFTAIVVVAAAVKEEEERDHTDHQSESLEDYLHYDFLIEEEGEGEGEGYKGGVFGNSSFSTTTTTGELINYYSEEEEEFVHKWIEKGSVGGYLGLNRALKSVTLPVTVNILLIGFDADGNNGIEISEDNFLPWFEHIEHMLPHLVVPVGEEQTTTHTFRTPTTHVEYSIFLNVAKLCPLVTTIIEDLIYWNLRPEEMEDTTQHYEQEGESFYVDSIKFSAALQHLVNYLNMSDQYTLLILNPNSPFQSGKQRYGYRAGFSDSEISILYQNPQLSVPEPSRNVQKDTYTGTYSRTNVNVQVTSSRKVQYTDLSKESEGWAKIYVTEQATGQEEITKCTPDDGPGCLTTSRRQQTAVQIAEEILLNGTLNQREYLYRIYTEHSIHEDCLADCWIGHGRLAFIDLTAGPFEYGPTVAGEGVRTFGTIPSVPTTKVVAEEQQYNKEHPSFSQQNSEPNSEAVYKEYVAELTLLKSYWNQHCLHGESDFCVDLKSRMAALTGKYKDPSGPQPILAGHADEGHDTSVVLDNFLSNLGGIISLSIRHLVAPPTPLFSASYAERISFQLFVIEDYKNRTQSYFNYALFKQELLKLKLPSQEFSFTMKKLSIQDDPGLLSAFSTSLHSSVIPRLSVKGDFSTQVHTFIDSKELHHQLKVLQTSTDGSADFASFTVRHIPIFLFSVNQESPIFVDKYYQAKALVDMVIAVQSNVGSWESRLGCNKKPIYWDLRNPLKAMLASTALLLGGIVPTHVGYNQANSRAYQNWLWSVGDNPLSLTSQHAYFSTLHKDIVFRNYLVHSLNDSLATVNEGLAVLLNQKTYEDNWQAHNMIPLEELSEVYKDLKAHWKTISHHAHFLDYTGATSKLRDVFNLSRRFRELCIETAQILDLYKCLGADKQKQPFKLEWLVYVAVAIDVILLLLYILFNKSKVKVKIN